MLVVMEEVGEALSVAAGAVVSADAGGIVDAAVGSAAADGWLLSVAGCWRSPTGLSAPLTPAPFFVAGSTAGRDSSASDGMLHAVRQLER